MISRRKAVLTTALVAGLALPVAAQQQGQPDRMMGPGAGQGRMMGPGGGQGPMMGQGMMGQGSMPCPGMMGMGPGMGRGAMMGMGPMMGGPGQHIEGRIAFLKAELGITPEQEDAWNDYAEALRESASSMQAMHARMMSGDVPESLPERMALHQEMMSARIDALEGLTEATEELYEALSPEQRQTANNLMGMM